MSLIGTAIGALVALLPRPSLDKADARFIAGYDAGLKDGRREAQEAQVEVERLTRSHARLVDHIETLEREILLEQHICRHWKEEAERLAKHAIASRQRAEAQEQQGLLQQYQGLQPTPRWAEMNGRSAMAYAQAQQNLANQQQLANYANQAQTQQQAFGGFCNCVPSRAQVWAREPSNEPFAILRVGED
jgi:hypothetical protein